MHTETDLRELLRASAERADAAMSSTRPAFDEPVIPYAIARRRTTRRRMIAPITVAACTVAAVAGVVALTPNRTPADNPPAAERTSSTAVRSAPHPRTSSPTPQPVTVSAVPVTDDVRIDTRHDTGNYVTTDGTDKGGQEIISQLGGGRTFHLVIAPAAAFDDSNISRTHQVAIAGTTGYYAVLRLYPLSANGDGGSAPAGTVVFGTPDWDWAFASLQAGTKNDTQEGSPVNDRRAIVRGFDSLHATFASGTFRTPIRIGYLPEDVAITEADNYTSRSRLTEADISAHAAGKNMKELDISITHPSKAYGPADDGRTCIPHSFCVTRRHRNLPGGYVLQVQGIQYGEAVVQKVIDHITVAANLHDPSTYFVLTEPDN